MPLKRLYNEYSQQDGVNFAMADEEGGTVECHVSHEALQDYKDRLHHPGDDAEIFKAYREILERLASEMYDSGASYDQAGRLLITSDDFTHMTRTP